jgi:hypothetical protein
LAYAMLIRALAAVALIPIEPDDPGEIDHLMYITIIYTRGQSFPGKRPVYSTVTLFARFRG